MGNEIVKVKIKTEYITLGQLLKYKGIISMGNEAKEFITNNEIFVDGQIEKRRGKKLYIGNKILINNKVYCIE